LQGEERGPEPGAAVSREGTDGLPGRVRAGFHRADVRRDPGAIPAVQRRAGRVAGAVEVLTRPAGVTAEGVGGAYHGDGRTGDGDGDGAAARSGHRLRAPVGCITAG